MSRKSEFLKTTCSLDQKKKIKKAAQKRGLTVAAFLLMTALWAADQELAS